MKNLKLTAITLLFTGTSLFAQSNDAPRKAQATFGKMFPAAQCFGSYKTRVIF